MEVWLNVENIYGLEQFSNYETNEAGVLRNVKTKRILEGSINHGYIMFGLSQGGLTKHVLKHRLIAELFIWNPDNLPCVDHQDRNKLNNTVENLRWCSYEENSRNLSIPKRNTSGEMNISKCLNKGKPYWLVAFGSHRAGNRHEKIFKRDPDSNEIPDEVKQYRDTYALKWKGEFNPTS